jgi:hypothetical protein
LSTAPKRIPVRLITAPEEICFLALFIVPRLGSNVVIYAGVK